MVIVHGFLVGNVRRKKKQHLFYYWIG